MQYVVISEVCTLQNCTDKFNIAPVNRAQNLSLLEYYCSGRVSESGDTGQLLRLTKQLTIDILDH